MIILAIETSCDDTGVAILEIKKGENPLFKILSNIVSSQVKIHRKYGGVYPFLAKREHQRNLPIVLKKALKKANFSIFNFKFLISKKNQNAKIQIPKIDLIAVTAGPGLEPCLWVGVNFAKALSKTWNKPIIPINHIEAHIYANFLSLSEEIKNLKLKIKNYFPAICLVVSGGHTQLILMKSFGNYKILGETRDDAAGECFDKVARILGLGYPGGPVIAAKAAMKLKVKGEKLKVSLPRPMIYQKNYDFSFSGLKTAVLYNYKNQPEKIRKSKEYIQTMCAEVQQAIIDVLIKKTLKAAKEYKVNTIILGGGVAANNELRKQFKNKIKKEIPNSSFLIPNSQFCTDNAAMVGVASYYHWLRNPKKHWKDIEAEANLRL